jgi:hypothetical protein
MRLLGFDLNISVIPRWASSVEILGVAWPCSTEVAQAVAVERQRAAAVLAAAEERAHAVEERARLAEERAAAADARARGLEGEADAARAAHAAELEQVRAEGAAERGFADGSMGALLQLPIVGRA